MRCNLTSLALLLLPALACGGSRESPFVDGPPPVEVQERFLNECGVPHDSRDRAPKMVMSDAPDRRDYAGPFCTVKLYWSGSKLDEIDIAAGVEEDWLRIFSETVVMPLLKPEAQTLVRHEFLARLAGGYPMKIQRKVLGGSFSLELSFDRGHVSGARYRFTR